MRIDGIVSAHKLSLVRAITSDPLKIHEQNLIHTSAAYTFHHPGLEVKVKGYTRSVLVHCYRLLWSSSSVDVQGAVLSLSSNT